LKIITNNPTAVVDYLCKKIYEILDYKEYVVMAVPGGRSVKSVFVEFQNHTELPWDKIHLFMVDERLVPIENSESNFFLVKEQFGNYLIEKKIIEKNNLHPFILDESVDDFGVEKYKEELKKYGGKFDIVLLGVGEDCHIGGLFPNYTIEDDEEYFIHFHESPKSPKDRMTASKNLIKSAKVGVIIFLGEGKRESYNNFNDENIKLNDCPAKLVKEIENYIVYTDLEDKNNGEL